MKVLHLSTNGRSGGAGVAAWRLHRQLRALGVESAMLGLQAEATPEGLLSAREFAPTADPRAAAFRRLFVTDNRTPVSETWFSAELEGVDLAEHPAVRAADILHLHWISGLLNAAQVARLAAAGKALVWTMHDMAPFTGGCHYSAGCERFASGCAGCPQLRAFGGKLAAAQLADKNELWRDTRGGVIALNAWMSGLVARSPLFGKYERATIGNGIDLERFHPRHRDAARRDLGLADDSLALLFVADSLRERRKGGAILAEALRRLATAQQRRRSTGAPEVVLLAVGRDEFPAGEVPIRALGWADEDRLAAYYAAADAFVLPSLEDNQPNTVVESLASGTPVIAFPVGGVPELVRPGETGELAAATSAKGLAECLARIVAAPSSLAALRASSRAFAERHFEGARLAAAVRDFYGRVAELPRSRAPRSSPTTGPALERLLAEASPESFGRAPGEFLGCGDAGRFEPDGRGDEPPESRGAAAGPRSERNLLRAQLADLQRNFLAAEADRIARGAVIEEQGRAYSELQGECHRRLGELRQLHETAESLRNERNLLQAQLADLRGNFAATEADRLQRGTVIENQGRELSALHAEFDRHLRELRALQALAEDLRNERNLLRAQLADQARQFASTEADRLERGAVIQNQGREIATLQGEVDRRLSELHALHAVAETLRNERNLLQAQFADLQRNFAGTEADRVQRGVVIENQGREVAALHAEVDRRLGELHSLHSVAEELRNERNLLRARLDDLHGNFAAVEEDRRARGAVIEAQGREVSRLQGEVHRRLEELHRLYPAADALRNERNLLQAQLADLSRHFAAAEEDRAARLRVIEQQGAARAELERANAELARECDRWRGSAQVATEESKARAAALSACERTLARCETALGERSAALAKLEARWWIRLARRIGFR